MSETSLGKREKKITKGQERKQRVEAAKAKQSTVSWIIIGVIIVAVIGGAWYAFAPVLTRAGQTTTVGNITDPTLTTCIEESALVMHIHVYLSIYINGEPYYIPANIGISQTCTRPIHTHEAGGMIHVESPVAYPYTLGDFFLVWNQPFNKNQILNYTIDSTHKLTMTINGFPNDEFGKHVLQDGERIEIKYG